MIFHKKTIIKIFTNITFTTTNHKMSENKDENIKTLMTQFSKLGAQLTLNYTIKFIENIEKNYPKVPKDEFLNLAIETFKENDIQINAKIPTPRQKVKDEDRCSKILTTGQNKGKKCSLPKSGGSNYCKRHRDRVLISASPDKKSKIVGDYLKLLQPKPSPAPLRLIPHKNKNLFLEENTKLVFEYDDEENKYIVIGAYIQDKEDEEAGIAELSKADKILCDKNSWEYKK